MRDDDTDTADVAARLRARIGRLSGRARGGAARPDPAEAAAYAEAVRAVFLAGMKDDIPGPLGPLPPAVPPAPLPPAVPPAPSPPAVPPAPLPAADPPAPSPAVVAAVTPTTALAPEPEATSRPANRRRLQPGETAPDFLLRTPSSVKPVADEFFQDLTRRVEADR